MSEETIQQLIQAGVGVIALIVLVLFIGLAFVGLRIGGRIVDALVKGLANLLTERDAEWKKLVEDTNEALRTNAEHRRQQTEYSRQTVAGLDGLRTDLSPLPNAINQLLTKFGNLEVLVNDLSTKMDASKCDEVLAAVQDLKSVVEALTSEVRGKTPAQSE